MFYMDGATANKLFILANFRNELLTFSPPPYITDPNRENKEEWVIVLVYENEEIQTVRERERQTERDTRRER